MQRKHLLLAGGAAAALVALLLLMMSGGFSDSGTLTASANEAPTAGTTTLAPPPLDGCGANVQYWAYSAPAGSNNFGPDQAPANVSDAYTRMREKAASDPLWLATVRMFSTDGVDLDAAKAQAQAQAYVDNRELWKSDCDDFFNNLGSVRLGQDDATYRTLGMIPNADGTSMPRLVKADEGVSVGQSLYYAYKGNPERELRVLCDYQPVAPEFANVVTVAVALAPPPPAPAPTTEQPQPETPETPCVNCGGSGQCTENCNPCTENCGPKPCEETGTCQPAGKDPSKDPQNHDNVPQGDTRTGPESDNSSEISRGNVPPVDQGNGIPQGATSGPAAPRGTPAPASSQVQGTTSIAPPTQAADTAAPASAKPTADGAIVTPGP